MSLRMKDRVAVFVCDTCGHTSRTGASWWTHTVAGRTPKHWCPSCATSEGIDGTNERHTT